MQPDSSGTDHLVEESNLQLLIHELKQLLPKQSCQLKCKIMDESEIPIDIHTSKLLDWLISRRHVPRDWNKKVVPVREKINEAIKDMPVDKSVTELLSGSYINYYHCQKLVEILKETEGSSKNVFGQYSSKRIKDWMEIIKMYEKENVYLGEVASLLQRNVIYEVPSLRKQIARSVNLSSDYEKKAVGYERLAESAKRDFASNCKQLEIDGVKIKQELINKAADFPKMCDQIAAEIKSLIPAIEFYQNAVHSLLDSKKTVLQMLNYVIENGNTTVYQWKYKKVPESVQTISLLVEEEPTAEDNDAIDFGIEEDLNVEENIDWGISAVDSDVAEKAETVSNSKAVAQGEEACTILGHMDTRNLIINDILELEAFIKVRLHEMKSDKDGLSLTLLPDCLQMHDLKTIQGMLQKIQSAHSNLTSPVSLHYLNITTSQRYVDQLAEKLKQKLTTHEKMLSSRDWVRKQKEEVLKEAEELKGKVDVLIGKSKELQELIEQDLSRRYKGRPVNLIAGANIL